MTRTMAWAGIACLVGATVASAGDDLVRLGGTGDAETTATHWRGGGYRGGWGGGGWGGGGYYGGGWGVGFRSPGFSFNYGWGGRPYYSSYYARPWVYSRPAYSYYSPSYYAPSYYSPSYYAPSYYSPCAVDGPVPTTTLVEPPFASAPAPATSAPIVTNQTYRYDGSPRPFAPNLAPAPTGAPKATPRDGRLASLRETPAPLAWTAYGETPKAAPAAPARDLVRASYPAFGDEPLGDARGSGITGGAMFFTHLRK